MADDPENPSGAVYETQSDDGKTPEALVTFWCQCLSLADSEEKVWRDKCAHIIDIYRGRASALTKASASTVSASPSSFNILRANIRTIRPNLYNSTPIPDIRRRFGDRDELSQFAGDLLERAVSADLDDGNFDRVMIGATQDMLLVGRGVPWVRLDGVIEDEANVKSVSVRMELVPWDEFRRSSGRCWDDVWWVARRHLMRREDVRKINPEAAGQIRLDYSLNGKPRSGDGADSEVYKRAEVWEVWDKDTRRVLWIARSWREAPLLVADDPLQLSGFFPCPPPLYDDADTSSLVPVPDYLSYENQAKELESLTQRIRALVAVLKWRGAYDSVLSEIGEVMTSDDGVLVPVKNAAAIMSAGGMEKAIWLMPLDKAIAVLRSLYESREQVKQTIYEITGIADIQRGSSNPNETLGAQQLKAQWGSGRLQERQRAVQLMARNLIRMKVELLAEHAPQDLLLEMAGMEMPQPEPPEMPSVPQMQMPPAPQPQMPPLVQTRIPPAPMPLLRPSPMNGGMPNVPAS